MIAAGNDRDKNGLIARLDFYAAMMSDGGFSRAALKIAYFLLYRHMNGTTRPCDPAIATLVEETGVSRRGVISAIHELEQSGWWQVIGGRSGAGRGNANSYQPNFEKANAAFPVRRGEKVNATAPFGAEKRCKVASEKVQCGSASALEKQGGFALNQEEPGKKPPIVPKATVLAMSPVAASGEAAEINLERDRPLCFHWKAIDDDWIIFLGLPPPRKRRYAEARASVLLEALIGNLVAPGQWISYSRRKEWWTTGRRYRGSSYSYATVLTAVDTLAALGLLEHDQKPPGNLGWQSRFRATTKLLQAVKICRRSFTIPSS